jgi:N-acylneuraminate cytidylyltransferase
MIRPPRLATDDATVVQVCLDVLHTVEQAGRNYDIMCCLYPTAPLRTSGDINAVMKLIEPGVCDFAMAVTTYSHPPHQALRCDKNGVLIPVWPDLINLRQTQIGMLAVDNGSTYAVTTKAFRSVKSFYGPTLRGHLMPRARSVDIDVAEDYELAKYYAQTVRQ